MKEGKLLKTLEGHTKKIYGIRLTKDEKKSFHILGIQL
jgi:hypothetical protein